MNDGNMIQEPPACPVCGLAVEERDPRRGKPLSIHRACRNRRREELRKERERGRRMSQESLLMASRNDVAEAAAELRRQVAWRNEAVGPADHGTVELCYWSVRCMAALMRLEPETLMAYEDRWAVDLARSIGRKGMDRIAGLTGCVFCQVGVGRFGVSFSPCERRVSGRFGVGRSCWLLVIALVIA